MREENWVSSLAYLLIPSLLKGNHLYLTNEGDDDDDVFDRGRNSATTAERGGRGKRGPGGGGKKGVYVRVRH